jgi:hypothetical protein
MVWVDALVIPAQMIHLIAGGDFTHHQLIDKSMRLHEHAVEPEAAVTTPTRSPGPNPTDTKLWVTRASFVDLGPEPLFSRLPGH